MCNAWQRRAVRRRRFPPRRVAGPEPLMGRGRGWRRPCPRTERVEAGAWARADAIIARIRELRSDTVGSGGPKPESIGSQRLLEAAAGGRVRDSRLWTEVAAAVGAGANTTALVGTAEQVADSLADYHALGVTTFLIRGFDPLEDAIRYGAELLPAVRAAVARRGVARVAAA